MARAGAPRIARCEQKVWRRMWTPGFTLRPPRRPPHVVLHHLLRQRRSPFPGTARAGLAGADALAVPSPGASSSARTARDHPSWLVTWPFQSDRSTVSCRFDRSTSPTPAPSSRRTGGRPHRRAARSGERRGHRAVPPPRTSRSNASKSWNCADDFGVVSSRIEHGIRVDHLPLHRRLQQHVQDGQHVVHRLRRLRASAGASAPARPRW